MAGCPPPLGHSYFPLQSTLISLRFIINWDRKWRTGENKHTWHRKKQSPASPKSQQTPVNLHRGWRPEEALKSWLHFQSHVKKAYIYFLQKDSLLCCVGRVKIIPKLQCVTPKFGKSQSAEGHSKPTEIIWEGNTAFVGNSRLQSYLQQAPNGHLSEQRSYLSVSMLVWTWGKNLPEVRVPTPRGVASEDPHADETWGVENETVI